MRERASVPADNNRFLVDIDRIHIYRYTNCLRTGLDQYMPIGSILLHTGSVYLEHCKPLVATADPRGTVSNSSRLLCAGLATLSLEAYKSLGGRLHVKDVGIGAAMLSLLTKIDDQLIDSFSFHGGMGSDPEEVADQVRVQLEPTLISIRTGVPATLETRCNLAAALGRRLRALSDDPRRLEHLLSVISQGWEIQAIGVSTLCRQPGEVSLDQVIRASRDISGAWLLMVTLVGTLPADASRPLLSDEEESFYEWGEYIQQADALADLDKDIQDGLVCTVPGHYAYRRDPETFLAAAANRDSDSLYALYADTGADLACLPSSRQRHKLLAPLAELGHVGLILEWIHGLLLWRYLQHPRCRRVDSHRLVRPLLHDPQGWTNFVLNSAMEEVSCSAH